MYLLILVLGLNFSTLKADQQESHAVIKSTQSYASKPCQSQKEKLCRPHSSNDIINALQESLKSE